MDGILYPRFVTAEQLEKVKTFQIRPDDIFVTCYPKSGTHWLIKVALLIISRGNDQLVERAPELFKDYQWFEAAGMPGTVQVNVIATY